MKIEKRENRSVIRHPMRRSYNMTELQGILISLPRLAVGFDEIRNQVRDTPSNATVFFDETGGYLHIYTSEGWIGAPVKDQYDEYSLDGDMAPFCS